MPGISIERLEHRAQFLALGHRNDVERWPVEDHVGALPLGIQLQAEAFEAFGEPWHQPRRIAHAIPSDATSRRRKILPTGDFGISATSTYSRGRCNRRGSNPGTRRRAHRPRSRRSA
jgi:hypothetical protein